jgi:hypothetical protein
MKKYTKEQFIETVANSVSIREVITKLGRIPAGGNYQTVHKLIDNYSLDTSHFLGQGHSKGKKIGFKRPIEDYLSNKYPTQSHRLKLRLISEGLFDRRCYNCNNTIWQNQPIPIELEHIDGNHANNNLDNLTLLCPNCHAQTPTYRGKNISYKS